MLRSFFLVAFVLAVIAAPEAPRADGDVDRGKALFGQCDACHEVGENARNRVGPVLNNIVGRKAGTRPGFPYSRGMREAASEGLVWTRETLDGYIENPRQYLRGTRMAYAGLRNEQAREDLIAYLASIKIDAAPKVDRVYP